MTGIVTRRQWGARHRDGFDDRSLPATVVYLHHSVTIAPDTIWTDTNFDGVEDDEVRRMREIEDIGQQRFGRGFPYTYAVMPSGRVYQGHSAHRVGAHTKGYNTAGVGIVWVGNYETATFDLRALVDGTAWLLRDLHRRGVITRPAITGGHRQVFSTACPGQKAFDLIGEINRRAASGDFTTSPTTTAQQVYKEEDDMVLQCVELSRVALAVSGQVIEVTGAKERGYLQKQIETGKLVDVQLTAAAFKKALGES